MYVSIYFFLISSILKCLALHAHHASEMTLTVVDINSRLISKGPVHKLVNQIASIPRANDGPRHGKRSRGSSGVAFLLNLSCPCSHYDLTFEPSKTYAEFKVNLPHFPPFLGKCWDPFEDMYHV